MKRRLSLAAAAAAATSVLAVPATSAGAAGGAAPVPQGTQSDSTYAASGSHVTTSYPTTQQVSCYRPEVPALLPATLFNLGPAEGYSGESACPGATTSENTGAAGPYPSQVGSNSYAPATTPMLVKGHSESDLRVDPTNPKHIIGSSKWFVSPEGYNHVLGFYESFDGGTTWPSQGHIPGYEGWTDNTDPIGAFDTSGNYYSLILPYQFFYNSDGSHNYQTNQNLEPNPTLPAEAITMAVRPHGATSATTWYCGGPTELCGSGRNFDVVAAYAPKGHEPDKQWLTIDRNPGPYQNTMYAMWVDLTSLTAHPYVATAHANPDGSHTAWSAPIPLPTLGSNPQGATYLLPHVTPDGTVWTTVTNTAPAQGYSFDTITVDKSTDGVRTWSAVSTVADKLVAPPYTYSNTTFPDGIEDSFTTGTTATAGGSYPLYVAYQDYSTGRVNVLLTASYDGGRSWSTPIQVNDNATPVDEFQPNATTAPDGTVSIAFYDRRLACPSATDPSAGSAGIALDTANPKSPGVAPYGQANYCMTSAVQFYTPGLVPEGHNIRLTQVWDPQLNAPHSSSPTSATTFIGDYFGNDIAPSPNGSGYTDYTTSVTTYDAGANPSNRQQQVVVAVRVP